MSDTVTSDTACNGTKTVESLHLTAISHGQNGEFDIAEKYIDRALTIEPNSATLLNSKAIILKRFNKVEAAKTCYLHSIQCDAENPAIIT